MASRRWGRQRKACGPPACPAAPKHSSTGRRSTGGPQPEFSLEFRTGGVAGPRGLGVVRTLDFLRVLIGCFSILSKYLAQHLWNPSPHCFPRETPSCPRSGPQAPTALAPGLTLQLPPPTAGGGVSQTVCRGPLPLTPTRPRSLQPWPSYVVASRHHGSSYGTARRENAHGGGRDQRWWFSIPEIHLGVGAPSKGEKAVLVSQSQECGRQALRGAGAPCAQRALGTAA